jgi:hypothetical protein
MIHLTVDFEQEDPRLNGIRKGRGTLCSIEGTIKLLDFLKEHKVESTIFVSAFFAEHRPEIIKRILKDGHELACNGYEYFYSEMSGQQIKNDIIKAKKVLEEISKTQVVGFRAPQMMFVPEVTETLEKNGFLYGSTLVSAKVSREHNHKLSPLKPFYPLRSTTFVEIPICGSLSQRVPLTSHEIKTRGAKWLIKSCKKLLEANINPTIMINSWDVYPMAKKGLPTEYMDNTGDEFLELLREFIFYFCSLEFKSLKTPLNA